jgi:hypothetical protein
VEEEKCTQDYDLSVDGRIILKAILKKEFERCELDFCGS